MVILYIDDVHHKVVNGKCVIGQIPRPIVKNRTTCQCRKFEVDIDY